jgi:hypothetical protein
MSYVFFFKLYVIPDGSLCGMVYIVIYHNACAEMDEIVCGDV